MRVGVGEVGAGEVRASQVNRPQVTLGKPAPDHGDGCLNVGYVSWRNNDANDERLRRITDGANQPKRCVSSGGGQVLR